MAEYDPSVLKKLADRLYNRAAWVSALHILFGFLLGLIPGGIVRLLYGHVSLQTLGQLVFFCAIAPVAGAVIGYVSGSQKAFLMRVEAQRLLVLLEIERNTRAAKP
jgi:hypothetical protein